MRIRSVIALALAPFLVAVPAAGATALDREARELEDERPLFELSALLGPASLSDVGALPKALSARLFRPGDFGTLADLGSIGNLANAGTGRPDADDPAREYELPSPLGLLPALPESLAFDPTSDTYLASSFGTGAVFRGSLHDDAAVEILPPAAERLSAVGIEVDAHGRFYVLNAILGTMPCTNPTAGTSSRSRPVSAGS